MKFLFSLFIVFLAIQLVFADEEDVIGFSAPSLHPAMRGSQHWVLSTERDVQPTATVFWRVYLKLRNLAELESLSLRLADPTSPEYGQLVDLEYIHARFTPLQDQVDAVLSWVQSHSAAHEVVQIPAGRQYIRFRSTVADLESLFRTRFGYYRSLLSDQFHLRPVEQYYVPSRLLSAIDYVDQFSELPNQPLASRFRSEAAADSYETATPSFLVSKYGIVEATSAVAGSTSATVQFAPNWYSSRDLQTFFTKYVPKMSGQQVFSTFGVNGNAPTGIPAKPSVESNLDQQYIMGIGNFVESSIYYVVDPSSGIEEGFVDYATYINNQNKFPFVQSISYGQYGGQYTNATVQRLSAELQMAGTRGYSGLLASGDNGVGAKCSAGQCVSFEFDFPSSPWLTMVGATQFNSATSTTSPGQETGATLSAGGFSQDYYRPTWQATAVNDYLTSGVSLPASSLYNSNGRGYPDISAVGQSVEVVVSGASELVGGTSCSAPITAGIFALLNNYRISNGKAPLGWLNPFIYQNPAAFNDITVGNNQYCTVFCCCSGFNARKGWDPVTGLGSPNYPNLLAAVKKLN